MLESEVQAVARRLAELGADTSTRVFRMSWWSDRMIAWAMSNDDFKTQLFRLVDVYPGLDDDDDLARHLGEYFEDVDVSRLLDAGMRVADHVPGGHRLEASVVRRNIERMARQFIVGEDPQQTVDGLHLLWREGSASTVDLLGERTITASQADRYAGRVGELLSALLSATPSWAPDPHLEADDLGPLSRVNVSVKPTALATHYEPLSGAEGVASAIDRLKPALLDAAQAAAHIHLDMEHRDVRDLTIDLLEALAGDSALDHLSLGVVVQAYLRDAERDLRRIIEISEARSVPLTVRLVKGAYWDTETVIAAQMGWPSPVWARKAETDASYERLTRILHDHHGDVRAAFASHNLRSLAHAVVSARQCDIPDHGYELQMLYGMAEPVHLAVKRLGLRLRVYTPVGQLVPGMAYLVRRLLENTSNESFVRHRFAEGDELDALLEPPDEQAIEAVSEAGHDDDTRPAVGDGRSPTGATAPNRYHPEPVAEWRRPPARRAMADALDRISDQLDTDIPVVIGGERRRTGRILPSLDPGCPSRVVARQHLAGPDDVADAISAAADAHRGWAATPPADRAAVLFGAAGWMRQRRIEIAALEVFEAGKPWAEADADVCEAIDFCEYYGREMLRLAAGGRVQSPPGETNVLRYDPLGVVGVIAPWNFPLAIPCGMTSAALVAGNAVVLKPAEQTPATASVLVDAFEAAGLPPGVLSFLPGIGSEIGGQMVDHPGISMIAFTGSLPVGLEIRRRAAGLVDGQRQLKRVVSELGGKNAIVVGHDADLDQVVPAVVHSAFGFAGQKCSAASRLIVHRRLFDECLARVAEATAQLLVGHPQAPSTVVGPLIDAEAQARVERYVAHEERVGHVVARAPAPPSNGFFVAPSVIAGADPADPIACDELFGPVLAVFPAESLEAGIETANSTPFALTAGVFTRSPAAIAYAVERVRAGNLYINRGITGAVVGRQPFGGYGHSGAGSKAGGPDYLAHFLQARTITENTVRQGFAPPTSDEKT